MSGVSVDVLRDVLRRIVAAYEEIEVGDTAEAAAILADLEDDVVALIDGAAS